MRVALLGLCACSLDAANPPTVDVKFPEADLAGGVIPFRIGGPFAVMVTGTKAELGAVSHATVEIVSGSVPMDAVATATVTLADQGDGSLAGTASLKWPLGGPAVGGDPLRVRALVGNAAKIVDVPLETATLSLSPTGKLTNTGTDVVQPLCIESSSTDGSVALHLTGAKLDTGMLNGTVTLAPGVCSGAFDSKNPSSVAQLKLFVSDSSLQIDASLTTTRATAEFSLMSAPQGTLTLDLTTATTTPARGSIADVQVTAKLDEKSPAKDIVITFQTIPMIAITPMSVKTDGMGKASANFQMPAEGSQRVTALSGSVQSPPVTFWP